MVTYRTTRVSQRTKAAGLLRYAGVLLLIMAACLSSWVCLVSYKYAFEDFAIRQAALLLNKTGDETKYANRSLVRVPFPFDMPSLSPKGFIPTPELQERLGS